MSYGLPLLNGLCAFEASARHLSFKRAADELCVTQGAVSQRVKSLEASIGSSSGACRVACF
jgi:LysR family glycine cleavage system transcriptional activator